MRRLLPTLGAALLSGALVGCGLNNDGPVLPLPIQQLVLSPDTGVPGTQVTIHGEGLLSESGEWPDVAFDGLAAELIVARDDLVVVVVPNGVWRECDELLVELRRPDGSLLGVAEFEVGSYYGPIGVIEEVDPPEGPPGTVVTLSGRGLSPDGGPVDIIFGPARAEVLQVEPDRVVCVAPDGIAAGTRVWILLDNGLAGVCPGTSFLYR